MILGAGVSMSFSFQPMMGELVFARAVEAAIVDADFIAVTVIGHSGGLAVDPAAFRLKTGDLIG